MKFTWPRPLRHKLGTERTYKAFAWFPIYVSFSSNQWIWLENYLRTDEYRERQRGCEWFEGPRWRFQWAKEILDEKEKL